MHKWLEEVSSGRGREYTECMPNVKVSPELVELLSSAIAERPMTTLDVQAFLGDAGVALTLRAVRNLLDRMAVRPATCRRKPMPRDRLAHRVAKWRQSIARASVAGRAGRYARRPRTADVEE